MRPNSSVYSTRGSFCAGAVDADLKEQRERNALDRVRPRRRAPLAPSGSRRDRWRCRRHHCHLRCRRYHLYSVVFSGVYEVGVVSELEFVVELELCAI